MRRSTRADKTWRVSELVGRVAVAVFGRGTARYAGYFAQQRVLLLALLLAFVLITFWKILTWQDSIGG